MSILKDKYYVVYFRSFIKPIIYPVYFTNKNAAKRAIRKKVSRKNRSYYEIVKGAKLKDFEFSFIFKLGNWGEFNKYDYPQGLSTGQKRKSYRTRMRRRLRRMGMLTLVKQKYSVRDDPMYVKLIKNRQKVAMCKNSLARAFRLERKPGHYYYIIVEKEISRKKGILFEVQALRVNMKSKEIKPMKVNVFKNDIIIPHLITEVQALYGTEIKRHLYQKPATA
jgi:hypothetical protein